MASNITEASVVLDGNRGPIGDEVCLTTTSGPDVHRVNTTADFIAIPGARLVAGLGRGAIPVSHMISANWESCDIE